MVEKIMSLPIGLRLMAAVVLVMAISLGGTMLWSTRQQEKLAIQQASDFAEGFSQMIMTGVTSMMASGDAKGIENFLDQLRKIHGMKSLRLLRGQAVEKQFGAGSSGAAQTDPVDRGVLEQGLPHAGTEEREGGLVYRAVLPMKASQNFLGKNCLTCHQVGEGTVLGAVSLQIGLEQIRQANRGFIRQILLAGAIFGLVVLWVCYVLVTHTVSRPLGAVMAQIQDISEGDGDLTKRLTVRSADEVGRLAAAFNVFMDKLHGIMAQVRDAAMHVATASGELSSASEQLSSGAQEQASSLEETAASLEEITGTVKQNADNARQANQLALGSRGTAEKGGQVVTMTVEAMGEINNSSKKIADIITAIDEIAFQTNLLALNAAVEAARAGEQGRGFAVVAAEVRNLAQRSATAAKEIKTLIQDSVAKVQHGSELVNKSGQTLEEIVTSVKRVTDIIGEIAAASQEQSSGIDQVNKAVTQMDQVVQSNAAQTEELSSTAHSLASQAEQLQALVGRFKLDGSAASKDMMRAGLSPKTSSRSTAKSILAKARPKKPDTGSRLIGLRNGSTQASEAVGVGNGSPLSKESGFEEF